MLYRGKEDTDFILTCDCGCGNGILFAFSEPWESGESSCLFLNLIESSGRYTAFWRFVRFWKRMWRLLTGRTVFLTDLVMDADQVAQLRACLEHVEEKMKEVKSP